MNKEQFYGQYINPTIEQPLSTKKENPLVLMAQACNNIGKDLSGSVLVSSSKRTVVSSPIPSKSRKSNSPPQGKRGVKRPASPPPASVPLVTKRMAIPPSPSLYFPHPSALMFDSLFLHQLSKSFPSSTSGFAHSLNSAFSPSSSTRSAYLVDSLLAPSGSFVCNWMSSPHAELGFCGQRFSNHYSLLEHLCSSHTSSPLKCSTSQPSFFSSNSVSKL